MAPAFSRRIGRAACCLIAPLLCAPLSAHAQVYRWTDANGNVHFSDQAAPGAEQIEVPPVSTVTLPAASAESETESTDRAPQEQAGYDTLRITFPDHESAFHSGDGTFTVTTAIEPPLAPVDELRLMYDGQVYAVGQSGTFLMSNIDRGTHTLQLQVVRGDNVIQTSSPVRFTVHRPSLLNPNRARSPRPVAP